MDLQDTVIVVTGGASGIGRAMAHRLASDGARAVIVVDLDGPGAATVAEEVTALGCDGRAETVDMTDQQAVEALIDRIEDGIGPIDLWCGNAGIGANGGVELPNDVWDATWNVNVMAHVVTARVLVPRWMERFAATGRGGHLLLTASAAGLLTNLGTAPYAVTKHACVALAEWILITYGERGVGVSCLCPQGVRTPMTEADGELAVEVVKAMGMIEPEEVAEAVAEGLADDRFLILPHPEVATYEQRRAGDRERWLAGMQRLQASLPGPTPGP
jgi:NAD(P)-dependent dehydrogenase (short-subunit alcohol dehydrogenase family)